MNLNRRLYYEVQKQADTSKQKINAADTSRVLKALRTVLRQKAEKEGLSAVFELLADFVREKRPKR